MKAEYWFALLAIVVFILVILFWSSIIYVAMHFIRKWW